MSRSRILSICARGTRVVFLIGTILMEIYDIVIDSMEASEYRAGKMLHLSKPRPKAAVAFIALACVGAAFSLVKIIYSLVYYWKVTKVSRDNPESKRAIEGRFEIINIAVKSLTLIFEDIAQAALPYWFVTRCSVDFDSIVKICFICVSPFLNFSYFTFIVVRFMWNYDGKHKSILRVVLIFLLIVNITPFTFGVLSSKEAFDRTHLIGNVPKIVLVQHKGFNGTQNVLESHPMLRKEKSLYAVWKIIERAENHCANISFKCKNGSFFTNEIFHDCLEVRFILCYHSTSLNIFYKIQICRKDASTCNNISPVKTGLSLKYTSDFCGEDEANPEQVNSTVLLRIMKNNERD